MIIPHKPLSVSCGKDYTLVLTTGGLYGCGRNHHGQLTGQEKHYLTLTKINIPVKNGSIQKESIPYEVISIACTDRTSYIITTEGLYYAGYNQIDGKNVDQFTKMMDNVIMISCSDSHTTVLTTEGLYWFGNMRGDARPQPPQYVNIDDINDILDINCGTNYTMVLTTTGLYGFGANYNGQLGVGMVSSYEEKPLLCNISNVKHVSCRFDTTFILTNDGSVYVCGTNNLIKKREYRLVNPTPLALTNITNIVSSHEHTIFVEKDKYHGYGSNYHNQLSYAAKTGISKNLFFKD